MSVFAKLRERIRFSRLATATPATSATDQRAGNVSVAKVATVSVAAPSIPTFRNLMSHDRRCPLCALVALKQLQNRNRVNQNGRPGAIPRVHLDAWRKALHLTREDMHFLANELHEQGAIIRENAYARILDNE